MPNHAIAFMPGGRQTADADGCDITLAVRQPTDKAPITVLVAVDRPVVRIGLSTILNSERDITIVGTADDGEEAYRLCRLLLPEIIILDLRLSKKDGVQVLCELMSANSWKAKVVIMTFCDTHEDIRSAVRAGAKAFLTKAADPEQICEAVRRVADGETYFPAEVRSKLLESFSQPELSKREIDVLEKMARGDSNKEIGAALYISDGTVRYHVNSIFRKLDAMGRAHAISVAIRRGMIRLS